MFGKLGWYMWENIKSSEQNRAQQTIFIFSSHYWDGSKDPDQKLVYIIMNAAENKKTLDYLGVYSTGMLKFSLWIHVYDWRRTLPTKPGGGRHLYW